MIRWLVGDRIGNDVEDAAVGWLEVIPRNVSGKNEDNFRIVGALCHQVSGAVIPQGTGFLFFVSYDSPYYGGGILTSHHTGS
jgi:hypothetical protein